MPPAREVIPGRLATFNISLMMLAAIDSVLAPHRSEDMALPASGPDVLIPFSIVSMLAIVLHELIAMSTDHGSLSRGKDEARLAWVAPEGEDGTVCLTWHDVFPPEWSDDGGQAATVILQRMVAAARGTIEVECDAADGKSRVIVCLPMAKD